MTTALVPIKEQAAKSNPPIRKSELMTAMLIRAEQKHAELDKTIKEARKKAGEEIQAALFKELMKTGLKVPLIDGFCPYNQTLTFKVPNVSAGLKEKIAAYNRMPQRAMEFRKEAVKEQIRESLTGDHKPKALEILEDPKLRMAIDQALVEIGGRG